MANSVHETEVEVGNAQGLHMRPAMLFVDTASKYKSKISVSNDVTTVDAKSIMEMTMLAATCGTRLTIRAEGGDAEKAVDALRVFIETTLSENSTA